MILVNKPQRRAQESGSPVFQELKAVCLVLGMSKPPANITMFQFFSGIEKKVSQLRRDAERRGRGFLLPPPPSCGALLNFFSPLS